MKKSTINILIIIVTVIVFIILSVLWNLDDLRKDVYFYNKGIINIENLKYTKLYNEDFSFINLNTSNYENSAFLNENNYFKDNIKIYNVDKDKVIYIDPFQDYQNEEEIYIYGGIYVKEAYYKEFLSTFNFNEYYKEISSDENVEPKSFTLSENESKIIRDIVLGNNSEDRIYDGVKHDLSEFAYNTH